jgi:hypothetical protein
MPALLPALLPVLHVQLLLGLAAGRLLLLEVQQRTPPGCGLQVGPGLLLLAGVLLLHLSVEMVNEKQEGGSSSISHSSRAQACLLQRDRAVETEQFGGIPASRGDAGMDLQA